MSAENEITKLRRKMHRIKWLFFFTRNRRYHTAYFYNFLKADVGYENWKYLPREVREQWDAAADSFDRQYGLVRAWESKWSNWKGKALEIGQNEKK